MRLPVERQAAVFDSDGGRGGNHRLHMADASIGKQKNKQTNKQKNVGYKLLSISFATSTLSLFHSLIRGLKMDDKKQ